MMAQTAFLFPGQGSQVLGLLSSLASYSPIIQQTFDQASQVLGKDLWALSQNGPQKMLNQTVWTQPVLLVAGVAVWRLWKAQGGAKPNFLAGHSLGEYTALSCANSLSFEAAIRLVAQRGHYMQTAVSEGQGAMAAIVGLNDSQIWDVCKRASENEQVTPANYNTLSQIVISGHTAAVDRAISLAKQAGAQLARKIPVSVPAHSPLMQQAAQQLAQALEEVSIQTPEIPIIHNVSAKTESTPAEIKQLLIEQLYSSVRWVDCIEALFNQGVRYFIECGPGQILTGLVKRIVPPEAKIIAIGELTHFKMALNFNLSL